MVGRPLLLASGRDEVASALLQAVRQSHASMSEEVSNAQARMVAAMVYDVNLSGGNVLHRRVLFDGRHLSFERCL